MSDRYEFDERLSEHIAPDVSIVADCDACGKHNNLAYGESWDFDGNRLIGYNICADCIHKWDESDGEDIISDILRRRENDTEVSLQMLDTGQVAWLRKACPQSNQGAAWLRTEIQMYGLLEGERKMSENSSSSSGIGLGGLVFVLFLALKLTGIDPVVSWSWWWITSPLWISAAFVILILIIMAAIIKYC